MRDTSRELIFRAAAVARACPQEWSEFLSAFKVRTDEIKNACISSPIDTIAVAQGRAQQCDALLRLFTDCVKDADQIQEKRR